jgi:hypothetical protein
VRGGLVKTKKSAIRMIGFRSRDRRRRGAAPFRLSKSSRLSGPDLPFDRRKRRDLRTLPEMKSAQRAMVFA